MLIFPGDEKNEGHASADGGVSDIERGETDFIAAALLQIETEKIHDFMPSGQQTVGEIPGDAAEDQAEGNLAGQRVRIKMMPRKKQCDERKQGDDGERDVVPAEEAPGRTGVAPVDKFEKTVNDDFFPVSREGFEHQQFGGLIQRKNNKRQRGDAQVRFPKNELGVGHFRLRMLI
jgi:hypothetical protein